MHFEDSAEDAAFRAEWRAWLTVNAKPRTPESGFAALVARGGDSADAVATGREWQHRLAAEGWGAIAWPREYGGRAATPTQTYIFAKELSEFEKPPDLYSIGLGMIGPTIILWGTDEQKSTYLPSMLDGSEIWCQLWSEPGAGSDVASVRTSARQSADGSWLLNGQKVWTSGAQWARWGLAVVRTDPAAAKHRGLSTLIVDMTAPGVDVRPLKEMSGGTTFNEVFFTDVVVPASNVVGPVGEGWKVALTTMAHERLTAGLMGVATLTPDPLLALARRATRNGRPAVEDPVIRQRLIDVLIRHRVLELTVFRTLTTAARTGVPGPESSTLKLSWSEVASAQAELALDLLSLGGTVTGPEAPYAGSIAELYTFAPSFHLGGGTDEIQRNVIGEQVLGLPKEPR